MKNGPFKTGCPDECSDKSIEFEALMNTLLVVGGTINVLTVIVLLAAFVLGTKIASKRKSFGDL